MSLANNSEHARVLKLEFRFKLFWACALLSSTLAFLCGVFQLPALVSPPLLESPFLSEASIGGRDFNNSLLVNTFTSCHGTVDCLEQLCTVYQNPSVSNLAIFPRNGKGSNCPVVFRQPEVGTAKSALLISMISTLVSLISIVVISFVARSPFGETPNYQET